MMDEDAKNERPVIYQLLPRLFSNSNLTNVKGGTIDKNGCGKLNHISNVALKAIKKLGITHIWYTGIIEHAKLTDYSDHGINGDPPDIVKGQAGSPYAVRDYYDVDPDLAVSVPDRMKEFEALVGRTHNAGMKVIIDFVPNHLARNYRSDSKPDGVTDFGTNDDLLQAFSPKNNFYYLPGKMFVSPVSGNDKESWNEKPARVTGNDCFKAKPAITDWYETVKLNYGVNYENGTSFFDPIPDTWLKMREIILFWASKGVDAFRCDMAEMVPVKFWEWLFHEVKKKYPYLQFIAEIYQPNRYYEFIFKAGFDFLYDKELFYNTIRGVITNDRPAIEITSCWQGTEGFQHRMLYFLENHDEQRIASDFFAKNPEKAFPGLVVMATMLHNPLLIYFGQELGERGMFEEGFSGKDGRTSIYDYWGLPLLQGWVNKGLFDEEALPKEAQKLRAGYSKVLNMVRTEPALAKGQFYDLMWSNLRNPSFNCSLIYAFLRYIDEQLLLVVANFSDKDLDYRLHIPHHFFETSGLCKRLYFSGHDKLEKNKMIQFPADVALNSGFGGRLKQRSASVYELKYKMEKRL
jgi:glycosidase